MKKENTVKYIIIGAGLSGLTSAYLLDKQGETNFLVLEGRNRIGGRIITKDTIDFGATWMHQPHQNILDLLDTLSMGKFVQYSEGKNILIYNTQAAPHYFLNDPNAPSSYRISGGSGTLINHLSTNIKSHIKTETTVSEIRDTKNGVTVITNAENYYAEKVIVTIPPRIASNITFTPQLPEATIKVMKQTHTWMSNAIKVGLTFKSPFWRERNFSGTIIGQVGAVTELYDHSSADNTTFALMGFVNEGLRTLSASERKKTILNHLVHCLGDEILNYLTYDEKDWSEDEFTSCEQIHSVYLTPSYGNPVFTDFYVNDKVLFSGTETSPIHGGYMDGAIYSGINAVHKLMK